MNHIVTRDIEDSAVVAAPNASYAERRATMAGETRTRILEACVAILARGVTELSIPAVARDAGVSVPTVYRNFPDKKSLVQATALHLKQLRSPVEAPPSLDELPAALRRNFAQSASTAEMVRAALASEPILEAKRELGEQQRRRRQTEDLLRDALAGCTAADRERAVLMTMVLCSSSTMRAFREITGSAPEIAADIVTWAIGRILDRPWVPSDGSPPKPTRPRAAKTRRAKQGQR